MDGYRIRGIMIFVFDTEFFVGDTLSIDNKMLLLLTRLSTTTDGSFHYPVFVVVAASRNCFGYIIHLSSSWVPAACG